MDQGEYSIQNDEEIQVEIPQEDTPLLPPRREHPRSKLCSQIFIGIIFIIFLLGIMIGIYLLVQDDQDWPVNATFELISRNAWGAKPSKESSVKLISPVGYLLLTHSATSNCDSFSSCQTIIKEMQNTYQNQPYNMSDLPFNFFISGDGKTYEGRGWDWCGSIDKVYNNQSISVAIIGNFVSIAPSDKELKELKALIDESIRRRKLKSDYILTGRDFKSSPTALFSAVKHWKHWVSKHS